MAAVLAMLAVLPYCGHCGNIERCTQASLVPSLSKSVCALFFLSILSIIILRTFFTFKLGLKRFSSDVLDVIQAF